MYKAARETIHAKPLMNGIWQDSTNVLESEVKIEDLEHEIIEITVYYRDGQCCLAGRVEQYTRGDGIQYCWVGHADHGLTLPFGTILTRKGIGGTSYSRGYTFNVHIR